MARLFAAFFVIMIAVVAHLWWRASRPPLTPADVPQAASVDEAAPTTPEDSQPDATSADPAADGTASQEGAVTRTLHRGGSTTIQVAEAGSGKPVEEFAVRLRRRSTPTKQNLPPRYVGHHAMGRCQLNGLDEGDNAVQVLPSQPGFLPSAILSVQPDPDGVTTITVQRSPICSIVVRWSDGLPATDIDVDLVDSARATPPRHAYDPMAYSVTTIRSRTSQRMPLLVSRGRTDDRGSIKLTLPSKRRHIWARVRAEDLLVRRNGAIHRSKWFAIHNPLNVTELRLPQPRPTFVKFSGRVLGLPAVYAQTSISIGQRSVPVVDGRFEADNILAGSIDVGLLVKTNDDRVRRVELGRIEVAGPGEVTRDFTCPLLGSITGSVQLDSRPFEGTLGVYERSKLRKITTTPVTGGRFHLPEVLSGNYVLAIEPEGDRRNPLWDPQRVRVVRDGETTRADISFAPRSLYLRLLDDEGQPLADTAFSVGLGPVQQQAISGPDGFVEIPYVPLQGNLRLWRSSAHTEELGAFDLAKINLSTVHDVLRSAAAAPKKDGRPDLPIKPARRRL